MLPELSSESWLTIFFVFLMLMREVIGLVRAALQKDTDADERGDAERQRWMTMLDTVLNRQHEKFVEFTNSVTQEFDRVIQEVEKRSNEALTRFAEVVAEKMSEVTEARVATLARIEAGINDAPTQTQQLVKDDLDAGFQKMQQVMSGQFATLSEQIKQHCENLDMLPGAKLLIETAFRKNRSYLEREFKAMAALISALEPQEQGKNGHSQQHSGTTQPAGGSAKLGDDRTSGGDRSGGHVGDHADSPGDTKSTVDGDVSPGTASGDLGHPE